MHLTPRQTRAPRWPRTAVDAVEVLDGMTAVFGTDAEAMPSPSARANYLLTRTLVVRFTKGTSR